MRVLIGPDTDDLDALYRPPAADWLRVNFVATIDGAAHGADGKTGSINNPADKRVFDHLRAVSDAIVVGAGTARAEGYGPVPGTPVVVVSGRGEVPERLRGAATGDVLLATVGSAEGLPTARALLGDDAVLVTGDETVDLAAVVDRLRARGLRQLLCEGGPRLFGDLLSAGQVDEVCLTWSPRLVAGEAPRIVTGAGVDVGVRAALLLEDDGTLLGRWYVDR